MKFEFVADIHRPVEVVFAFFRDVERHAAREGSRVPVYDRLTPGPTGPGTRYREVVCVLPGVHGEVLTELTGLEPGRTWRTASSPP